MAKKTYQMGKKQVSSPLPSLQCRPFLRSSQLVSCVAFVPVATVAGWCAGRVWGATVRPQFYSIYTSEQWIFDITLQSAPSLALEKTEMSPF